MKIEKFFREKVKSGKFYTECQQNFLKQGENLKQRENASLPQRGWTPLETTSVSCLRSFEGVTAPF